MTEPAAADRVTADPARTGYAEAAESWASGAMLAYGPLAEHLVDACPLTLTGCAALDAGAGTGAATRVLRDRGAFVVAVDLQADMLRHTRHGRQGSTTAAAVADVAVLPFRADAFDVVVAAFVLNHLADPASGLASMRRVCRPGGAILASSFAATRAAAKNVVDEVAMAYGWSAPAWYGAVRERGERVSTPDHLAAAAQTAGLRDAVVRETAVDVGLDDPELVVRYRMGMPQYAGLLATLAAPRQQAFHRDVVAAVAATNEVLRPMVLELVARVT